MKRSLHIPIRSRLLAILVTLFILGGIMLLHFVHVINRTGHYNAMDHRIDQGFSELYKLDIMLLQLGNTKRFDTTGTWSAPPGFSEISRILDSFTSGLEQLAGDPLLEEHPEITRQLTHAVSLAEELESDATRFLRSDPSPSERAFFNAQNHRKIDRLFGVRSDLHTLFREVTADAKKRLTRNLLWSLLISVILITLLIFYQSARISRWVGDLLISIRKLDRGIIPEPMETQSGDEFGEIARSLNHYLETLKEKVQFLKTIDRDDSETVFEPESGDVLGNELMVISGRLRKARREEEAQKQEEARRNWSSVGIARFAEILRSERENVQELSFRVIQNLVTYLDVTMGTLFLATRDESEQPVLESVASYAYDRRKFINKRFPFGEGLPGTCALEKEKIHINEIPEEYTDVISGVGHTKPREVLLVPMKLESEIFGILELASLQPLEPHEVEFVETLAESIASTLAAVKTNERTAELLRQSRKQADELKRQEEELKVSVRELEKAQEESNRKESELTGLLNAMNQSSLVAEFRTNGRFLHINDRFRTLMESPREQILGKHHAEFAVTERYSEEYRSFWNELRSGNSMTRLEKYHLFSGKEIWLQQTFTPVLNDAGKVEKILDIAIDVTRSRNQQKHLEEQAQEITRRSLEMESLNEAVNRSLVKCELDHDGIILDLNNKFSEITGYKRKELLGRNYRLFLRDMEKEQFEKIWGEVRKDKSYEGVIRRTRPTGEEIWLTSSFTPVKDEEGKIYKIYFLALDTTEKKLKYQLLEEANKEIERLKNRLRNGEE